MTLRIVLVSLAYVLFAAHLSRHNLDPLALVALLLPLLFAFKKTWATKVLEYVLYVAAILWIIPSVQIVKERMAEGMEYTRFVLIISAIVIYTLFAAYLLHKSNKAAVEKHE